MKESPTKSLIDRLTFLEQWHDDIVHTLARYDCETIDEVYHKGRADIIVEIRKLDFENYCPELTNDDEYFECSRFSCTECYLEKIGEQK